MTKSEIHEKVWGREEWLTNTDKYCGKKLYLTKGYQCSLHHHENKDETFYIESGRVFLELNGKTLTMLPGESQKIQPGERHRFSGLKDSVIIEISTHHNEQDSYRVPGQESRKIPKDEFLKIGGRY